ncbi:MAG: ankyrin repeat domain-containing protein [Candidatus Xenobiia bacterium LiM19]
MQTAVYQGNVAMAEILINHGADITRRDPAEQTLLQRAVYLNYPRIAALLRKSGLTD